MMLELIISSNAPHFSQEHHFFGHRYRIEFEWLEREASWTMHVFGDRDEAIALGLKVMLNWPILRDRRRGLGIMLRPITANAALTLASLHSDFVLVAYETI